MPLQCDVCNELALPTCPADESCFYGTDNGNSLRCYAAHSLQRHQKLQVVISPICPEVPSGWISTIFGLWGPPADVSNQLCQILLQSAQGFRFCMGSKFAISHWLGWSPLTRCWRCCAACDPWVCPWSIVLSVVLNVEYGDQELHIVFALWLQECYKFKVGHSCVFSHYLI